VQAKAGADVEAIHEARRQLDDVIREIQAVPGFETMLAPPTFDDVAEAADERPIIYISPAQRGGLALIVEGTDVRHLSLAGMTTNVVRERFGAYADAYSTYRASPDEKTAMWDGELDRMLRWLWDTVMEPILDATDADSDVVLVAGGLLGLLPLHAAWIEDQSMPSKRRYAIDHSTISYGPNARAVTAARQLAARATQGKSLVVIEPRPVSAPELEWAAIEGGVVAAALENVTVLRNGEATVAAFEREAQGAALLHLACHGLADLETPLESGLLMSGNRWITLRRLLDMDLEVRLAVLSACETSLPGTDLPDEVLALPTGLLQAGAAGVIASQWAVPDLETALLMVEFYRTWKGGAPARALTSAQKWVRDTTNEQKLNHLQRSIAEPEPWVTGEVLEPLLERVLLADPDAYDQVMPRNWAAFAHFGV
jgi:CHAT domain-containing protein